MSNLLLAINYKNITFISKCFLFLGMLNESLAQSSEPITPLPVSISFDYEKAKLGRRLFFEKKLSSDDSISCASCHDLSSGFGTDLKAVSEGVNGQKGERNSPTVFNAALNFTQFWDGRAKDLAKQAIEPVINPVEMGMESWDEAIDKLKDIEYYDKTFERLYDEPINAENLTHAISEYQKTLITANSPFDKYLNGDQTAINQQEKRGYTLFKAYGCVSCHQGKNVGGNMFQKLGVLKDINLESGTLNKDLGRYSVTGNEWDKRVFKVPSLRLAAVTPPYFHDGSVKTLEQAVKIMIDFQLAREVPEQDIQDIIAFLKSLVGKLPKGV